MAPHPLAQDFVVVAERPSLDLIVDDPALVRLPSGALLATFTFRGTRGDAAHSNPQRFNLARSEDDGRSWQKLSALELCDGMPFFHDGRLYILGNNLGRRDIVILCSDDDGASWSPTVTLFEGHFWNAPTGAARTDRFFYRAFGALVGDREHGAWLEGSSSVVAVGDLAGDLMSPAAWRLSRSVEYPGTPVALSGQVYPDHWTDHWLEPNVVNVAGRIRVLQRVRIDGYATSGICAVCDLTDDGTTLQYEFTQFYPMPGA